MTTPSTRASAGAVLLQAPAQRAGGEAEGDVDGGEAGDEQRGAREQPAAALLLEVDARTAR